MRSFVLALTALSLLHVAGAAASTSKAPLTVTRMVVRSAPWEDDRPLVATITPNHDGRGEQAVIQLTTSVDAHVKLTFYAVGAHGSIPVATLGAACQRSCTLRWKGGHLAPGTYASLLRLTDGSGRATTLGHLDYRAGQPATAPVVRIRHVDAYAARPSYQQGSTAQILVAADRPRLTVTVLRVGPETEPTTDDATVNGIPVLGPLTVDWSSHRLGWGTFLLPVATSWPSGVYFARFVTDDGQVGYAPFIVTAAQRSSHVLVVLGTNTWQAYNHYDADGDGLPDSWYVTQRRRVTPLERPYSPYGIPPNFRNYDLPFLHWLALHHPGADFVSDADLEAASGDDLAQRYDLVVLGGHEEYVGEGAYDALDRYRDLGGNILDMCADALYWKVDGSAGPDTITKVESWRDAGRPEAELLGAEYLANDDGTERAPMIVEQTPTDPGWFAFTGTGLAPGSPFGLFGIEIDHIAPQSPPQTIVLADAQSIFGPGKTAQMTLYTTTPQGAKVVDAGAYLLGRSAITDLLVEKPASGILENLWEWMSVP